MAKSDTCRVCGGTGRVPVYDENGKFMGYNHCSKCGGTGKVVETENQLKGGIRNG